MKYSFYIFSCLPDVCYVRGIIEKEFDIPITISMINGSICVGE